MKVPTPTLDAIAPAKDYPKTNRQGSNRETFLSSPGDGKPSSQSTGIGRNTVFGNVRGGADKSHDARMKTGAGSGAKVGLRSGFLTDEGSDCVGGIAVTKTYGK